LSEPKHLLVIRFSAMGDVTMTVPVLRALLAKRPDLKITILTKPFFSPIFLGLPNVSVYNVDLKRKHKGVIGLWRLYKELLRLQVDAVADLHNVLRTKILKTYFSFENIPFVQLNKGRKEKKKLTAAKNKVFKPLKTTHERYADVFRSLGFSIKLSTISSQIRPDIPPSVLQYSLTAHRKWIGIAPFAAHKGKMYPLNLMAEVIKSLENTNKYSIFLLGSKHEEKQLDKIALSLANCHNIAGKIKFSEEIALIANLDLMVAMDSGNAHLAAQFEIPTITLWGVTHPFAGFYPFQQDIKNAILVNRTEFPLVPTSVYGNTYPSEYSNIMASIQPATVVTKIEAVLEKATN